MFTDELVLLLYRGMAGAVSLALAVAILRSRDWRQQVFGAMVFVPFVLRALGLK